MSYETPIYFGCPVGEEKFVQISELFSYEDGTRLTTKDSEALARLVNTTVANSGEGVWINPETDQKGLRINGQKINLGVGKRAVKASYNGEVAFLRLPNSEVSASL